MLPGAEVSVQVDRHRLALTRFANSVIHQNVAEDATTMRLVVHLDGRTASGSTSVVSDGRRAVARRAGRRRRPGRSRGPELAGPGRRPPRPARPPASTSATAGATPADRAEVVRGFVDGAEGLETAGYCRTNHWTGAFASSAGQSVSGEAVECGALRDRPARRGRRPRAARAASIAELDGFALGRRAAAKARASQDAGRAAAGPLRGGAGAERGVRPDRQPRRQLVRRHGGQRAALLRSSSAPTSSTRRSRWSTTRWSSASGTTPRARHVRGCPWSTAAAPSG